MGRRIAIVGAGIGGLTLAIELHRRGIDAQVYEAAEELREVGAAVALSANAVRFLQERIGIRDGLATASADVDGVVWRDGRDGRELGRAMTRASYLAACGAPYYGIHRADLQQLLSGALPAGLLNLGKRVIGIDDAGTTATLRFADGGSAEADLVIGADGARSIVRRSLLGYEDALFAGCVAWRGIVAPEDLDLLPDPEAIQYWMGPGGHLLHYPIGSGEQNFFLVHRSESSWPDAGAWTVPAEEGEHLRLFDGWHPAVRQMIAAVSVPQRWALFHRPPLTHWSRGRITLLGDAAHAMVPHHGQGANQSIEDAIVLAAELSASTDWDAARARYQARREDRTRRVQTASITMGDLLHLPGGPRAEARNGRLASPQVWDRHLAWIHAYVADR